MEFWMFIMVTVLNALSLLVYIVVNRETKRVTESHIELIQKVNSALVETKVLKIARYAYFMVLILLVVLSYVLYFYWSI